MSVNVFSMTLSQHLIFCGFAVVFFLIQFFRTKRVYELILAVAVLCSLLVYVTGGTVMFYAVGILEGILLIAALTASIVQERAARKKEAAASAQAEASAPAEEQKA